ncbi:hypothetical protein J2W42_006433 [Rhizobium tibeticum]|uniref:hypothetical protein n=1 Tax=Rhizobium tibeticum TaxID=501024 RepID=UPI0027808F6F|nr:hypothetical protein [Rhizobium tibeticum]MDP9813559.1 hypothetical protein [Rhizobium tibeticum]
MSRVPRELQLEAWAQLGLLRRISFAFVIATTIVMLPLRPATATADRIHRTRTRCLPSRSNDRRHGLAVSGGRDRTDSMHVAPSARLEDQRDSVGERLYPRQSFDHRTAQMM